MIVALGREVVVEMRSNLRYSGIRPFMKYAVVQYPEVWRSA